MIDSILDILTLTSQKRDRTNEARQLVSQFNDDMIAAFKGDSLQPRYMTQLLWARLTLMRNRLERLGMSLALSFASDPNGGAQPFRTQWAHDGKYCFADVDRRAITTKQYHLGSRALKPIKHTGNLHYGVIESIRSDQACVCPSCGSVTTTDELLDGCNYCRTVFTIDDLNMKVNSFALRPDHMGDVVNKAELVKKFLKIAVAVLLVAGFVRSLFFVNWESFIYHMTSDASGADVLTGVFMLLGTVFMGVFGFALIALVVYMVSSFLLLPYLLVKGARDTGTSLAELASDTKFRQAVQAHDPVFSIESNIANIENKLLTVLFADTPTQTQGIFMGDPAPLLQRYRNVFDCNLVRARFVNYWLDAQWQRLALDFTVEVYRLDGGHIRKKTEQLHVVSAKARDALTQQTCDTHLTRCQSCGASYNILSGNTCAYCHQDLKLWQRDWVLSDIQTL